MNKNAGNKMTVLRPKYAYFILLRKHFTRQCCFSGIKAKCECSHGFRISYEND